MAWKIIRIFPKDDNRGVLMFLNLGEANLNLHMTDLNPGEADLNLHTTGLNPGEVGLNLNEADLNSF